MQACGGACQECTGGGHTWRVRGGERGGESRETSSMHAAAGGGGERVTGGANQWAGAPTCE